MELYLRASYTSSWLGAWTQGKLQILHPLLHSSYNFSPRDYVTKIELEVKKRAGNHWEIITL